MSVRLPVEQQADNHLLAVQRSLARKRSEAFRRETDAARIRAARDEWTAVTPFAATPRYVPPIRTNTPEAGTVGYEPESRAPGGGIDWGAVGLWLCAVGFCAAIWFGVLYGAARGVGGWK